ncbi:hypothetical protein BCS65_21520 [Vibrio cyclitrophicus]
MDMLAPYIGFLGVIVGSIISYVATYKLKRLEFEEKECQKRKEHLNLVYSTFLSNVTNATNALSLLDRKDYPTDLSPINHDLILIELFSPKEVYDKASLLVAELTDLFADEPSTTFGTIYKLRSDFIDAVKLHYK